ncbi:reverse transcriptase N-terminal domain-containing protein, partial [bacterium]|nr:reverse transcriptase N-terminal domain-containing protein [bacterium]
RKQMTEVEKLTGAASGLGKHWQAINWQKVNAEVKRLQMRIAKAVRADSLTAGF